MARTIPFSFTSGEIADAAEVNSDFAAIASWFGDIRDADVAADADLDGNKLSSTSGKRVPATRLETNAATDRVVASDASTPGNDAIRAVGGEHIKALTAAALSRILPASGISLGNLKITVHEVTLTNPGYGPTNFYAAADPTATFPVATYQLLGCYVKSGGAVIGNVVLTVLANDTTANWKGYLALYSASPGALVGTIKVVYVFASRS